MVDTAAPRITLPLMLGKSLLADIEVPIEVDASRLDNVRITVDGNFLDAVVFGLRKAARDLAAAGEAPVKWVTGVDQPDPALEWPTTPGSAVLADREVGAGPQVLILARIERRRPTDDVEYRWWGGHEDAAAAPERGSWTHSRPTSGYTLLQILYVAP